MRRQLATLKYGIKPAIIWFRQDLRLADNHALQKAIETNKPLLPLFILEDDNHFNKRVLGKASLWWLHHSLCALQNDLPDLCLRKGNVIQILSQVIKETGAQYLFYNKPYGAHDTYEEDQLKLEFKNSDLRIISCRGNLLNDPQDIYNQSERPYQIFTPYWHECLRKISPRLPVPRPNKIDTFKIESEQLNSWKLTPHNPDWAAKFTDYWQPGEQGAQQQLSKFINHSLCNYHILRDYPAKQGTSRLSPHIHWGEISITQLWHAIHTARMSMDISDNAIEAFSSEIGWREFSYYVAYHFPEISDQPLRQQFQNFPWLMNEAHLKAWQKGLTGYPIVDAGMRELWATGWMHNRVRMIVASFLVKHLLIAWQEGERWFWDTLVDADMANNAVNWQWVAGCGIDAAPYFRIFNPVLQGEKFDSQGIYVRKWVPELSGMPDSFIHKPWLAPQSILYESKVSLGTNYPYPIVDHKSARLRALEAYENFKNKMKLGR